MPTTSTGISLTDFDDMEGVGVPVINATASAAVDQVFDELYNGGVLPSVEEVVFTFVITAVTDMPSLGTGRYGVGSRWPTNSSTI